MVADNNYRNRTVLNAIHFLLLQLAHIIQGVHSFTTPLPPLLPSLSCPVHCLRAVVLASVTVWLHGLWSDARRPMAAVAIRGSIKSPQHVGDGDRWVSLLGKGAGSVL